MLVWVTDVSSVILSHFLMQLLKSISISHLSFLHLHRNTRLSTAEFTKSSHCGITMVEVAGWDSEVSQARVLFF